MRLFATVDQWSLVQSIILSVVCLLVAPVTGWTQTLQPIPLGQATAQPPTASTASQSNTTQLSPLQLGSHMTGQPERPMELTESHPYRITSRVHLQQGTRKGYLVLQIELAKGFHIYALTQDGTAPPSRIQVAPSAEFRMLGDFGPDRLATVIERDPIFDERIEKHKDEVQFFAPIEIAPGVDVTKLTTELTFNGQVCQDTSFCRPLSDIKVSGHFAGYFQRSAAKEPAPKQRPIGRASGSGEVIRLND